MMIYQKTNMLNTWFDGKVARVTCPTRDDERGSLLPIEFTLLPFVPQRIFTVVGNSVNIIRGEHGHRYGQQLLICLVGKIRVETYYRNQSVQTLLTPGSDGLLVGAYIWYRQIYLEASSILLVLASDPYDPSSYFYQKEEAI